MSPVNVSKSIAWLFKSQARQLLIYSGLLLLLRWVRGTRDERRTARGVIVGNENIAGNSPIIYVAVTMRCQDRWSAKFLVCTASG